MRLRLGYKVVEIISQVRRDQQTAAYMNIVDRRSGLSGYWGSGSLILAVQRPSQYFFTVGITVTLVMRRNMLKLPQIDIFRHCACL